ncbi:hypothetical protein J4471_05165 [Candidatus Woesearchaeota archaeon]|nr:hypothetical protein [Candidatus Woesearchaeota archaeon]
MNFDSLNKILLAVMVIISFLLVIGEPSIVKVLLLIGSLSSIYNLFTIRTKHNKKALNK